jgi:exportin-2 (importin alpha re-exporter)
MATDLQAIAGQLQASLDPQQSRQGMLQTHHIHHRYSGLTFIPAEQALKAQESTPGFSLALLQIVNTDSFPQATRLAAALFFKNFVRRNWVVCNGRIFYGGVD